MYSINFKKDEGLLDVEFSGKIDLEEQFNYIKSILAIEDLPRKLKLLQDFQNAEFAYQVKDIDSLVSSINKYLEQFENVRIASIHNKAAETASSFILSGAVKSDKFHYDVFSTRDAAELWLGI